MNKEKVTTVRVFYKKTGLIHGKKINEHIFVDKYFDFGINKNVFIDRVLDPTKYDITLFNFTNYYVCKYTYLNYEAKKVIALK